MKIALCQINTITGNIARNTRRIIDELEASARAGARLAVFPEMAVTGYPPKDLLEYTSFITEAGEALTQIHATAKRLGVDCIVGTVHTNLFGGKKELLNSAAHIAANGDIRFTFKKLLPTYDVFDEHRYFQPCPGAQRSPIHVYPGGAADGGDLAIGISICEDIWNDSQFWKSERLYEHDPVESLVASGANLIVNVSASPFVAGKPPRRQEMLRHAARRWQAPVVLVNQVGGCDQIIFDGGSCVMLPDGAVPAAAGWFTECTTVWDTAQRAHAEGFDAMLAAASDEVAGIREALTLGLRDYLAKTGFSHVIVGNSGGIDSAVVLTLAVSALGRDSAISVSMPGPFTSEATRADSAALARNLGARHIEVPIAGPFAAFGDLLQSPGAPLVETLFAGDTLAPSKLANENIQARIRGNILMWISNAIRRAAHAGAFHRQQERDGGWLLHALRRHVRRPGADQRCAEDDGVQAGAAPERDDGRADTAEHHRPRANGGTGAQPEGQRQPAALPRAGRDHPPVCGGAEGGGGDHRGRSGGRGDRAPRGAADRRRGVQARAGSAGLEGHEQGVWLRQADADRAGVREESDGCCRGTR